MAEPFRHQIRVRFAECDPQGVVFNAHYLAYFDVAITELWRAAFGSYQFMVDRGLDIVVGEAQVTFERGARFDDLLTLEIEIEKLGTTSIVSRLRVSRDDETVATGMLRHVLVELLSATKTPIPDWMRTGLAPWVTGEVAAR